MTATITGSTLRFNRKPHDQRSSGHDTFALLQVWLLALALGLCLLADTAVAQTAENKPDTAASQSPKIQLMLDLLGDADVQSWVKQQRQQSISTNNDAAVAAEPTLVERAGQALSATADRIVLHIKQFPVAVAGVFRAPVEVFRSRGESNFLALLGSLGLVLGAGALASVLVSRLMWPVKRRMEARQTIGFGEQVGTLLLRFLADVSGLISFAFVALLTTRFLFASHADQSLVYLLVGTGIGSVWAVVSATRFVLAPRRPDLRLVATDDTTARYISSRLVGLSVLVAVVLMYFELFRQFSLDGSETLRFWVALALVIWISVVTWNVRTGLTSIIKGGDENLTPGLERMAAWWPAVSIVVIVSTWLLIQLAIATAALDITPARGALALALILASPFLDTALRGVVRHSMPPMQGEGVVAEEGYRRTRLAYIRIGRVLMFAIGILVIGRLLGISFRNLAESSFGAQIAANGVQFLLTLAAGYLAWEIVNLWVSRQLAREVSVDEPDHEADGEAGAAGKSRLASVLPLVRTTLQIAIIVLTALLGLAQLGFNITPLLAGAGVVGLAVGFGAQALVKDIVSGIFFLLDDAFRLGEFIDVGGTVGTVERISIRSLRLRGVRGPVHIVPYGEIQKLTNHSRDWVIMKLSFHVPFETDTEKVRKIFKQIGQEMMEVPELAEVTLEPFKGQGVYDVDDIGIVVRAKFKTKPGKQFLIKKEVLKRIQQSFAENGIQFARREVRVQLPEATSKDLTAEEKQAIATSAAAMAQQAQAR